MPNVIDLTGKEFGLWTVLGPGEPGTRGLRRWHCRCSCGKERDVLEDNLLGGKSTSCGHTGYDKHRRDLTGKLFGRLTPLYYLGYNPSMHAAMWHCRCTCGNEVDVASGNLVSGHTTSCGCAQAEAQQSPAARVAALKESPLTGGYETNIRAKRYLLDNGKQKFEVKNMALFVRNNPDLFGVSNDAKSLLSAAKGLCGAANGRTQWHGWRVTLLPDPPAPSDAEERRAEDRIDPSAPIEITPELLLSLADDLKSVIVRCAECGKPIVKKGPATKYCRNCVRLRTIELVKASNKRNYHADIDASRAAKREYYAKNRDAVRAWQADYYARKKAKKAKEKPPE